MYQHFFKRFFDIFISFIGLLMLLPVFIILAILIYWEDGGPIFFIQQRVGRYNVPFYIYKFRSMRIEAPHDCATGELDNPDKWITKIGKWIRKTSLDELPQLINIIKGDMSIVGPRPVVLTETELISLRKLYGANQIRPGLTGWAQINGRDEVSVMRKAILDREYKTRISFLFDLRIFLETFGNVLGEKGIHEGQRS